MLELIGVSYRYPGYAREVLKGLDLRIEDGEIVGLVGPNESGKSTLCLVASGLAPASIGGTLKGEVRVDGAALAGRRSHELATLVGLVFQDPKTQRSGTTGTVFEEIAMGAVNLGLPVAETVARTRSAMRALRIEDLRDRDPQRLSSGQAQLVAIASILAMQPRHLVLDEPTAQLDPEGTRLVRQALAELAARGTALLVAEHKTDLLDGLCTRVIAIDGGVVALDGPVGPTLEDPALAAMGVEPPSRVRIAQALAGGGAGGGSAAAGRASAALDAILAEERGAAS